MDSSAKRLPERYSTVRRYEKCGYGWRYNNRLPEMKDIQYYGRVSTILFKTSTDVRLFGIGLYGDERDGVYTARVTIKFPHGINETSRLARYTTSEIAPIVFKDAILIRANIWNTISAYITGPTSKYGYEGKRRVVAGGVQFEFRKFESVSVAGEVEFGQIPELYFEALDNANLIQQSESEPLDDVIALNDGLSELGIIERPPELQEAFTSEFLEKFTPLRLLGQGGYGSVFEAEFNLTQGRYAVKRIPLTERDTDIKIALKEVVTLEKFEHPGIVRYHSAWIEKPPARWQKYSDVKLMKSLNSAELADYKDDSAFLYIQMEIGTSTLADWLGAKVDRNSIMIQSWFHQIVSAVGYIHGHYTMHRDLKPSNILIFSDDVVKVCDLGIATAFKTGEKTTAQIRTNYFDVYKAPEQMMFVYDQRVDIFSLGLILIELCVPMTSEQKSEIFTAIRINQPINILRDQPVALDLITKLTYVNRDLRPTINEIMRHPFFATIEQNSTLISKHPLVTRL